MESKLSIVGIGPGDPLLMSLKAREALDGADHIVGYRKYIELISDIIPKKPVFSSTMGKEVDRVSEAFDLLDHGNVALISSGDPNVYGMGGLGLEIALKKGMLDRVEVIPGVTSFAATACLAGITFRKAVAVVSLSDLLTPWQDIKKRVEAVSQNAIPLALYNPRSKRRKHQLEEVLEIYARGGLGKAYVLIARNVYRDGQELIWTTVEGLKGNRDLLNKVDMFTLLIIEGDGMMRGKASVRKSALNLVGIGPGSLEMLTLEAKDTLKRSDLLLGSKRYFSSLNLLGEDHKRENADSQKDRKGTPYEYENSSAPRSVIVPEALLSKAKEFGPPDIKDRMEDRLIKAKETAAKGDIASILTGGDPSIFGSGWRALEETAMHVCPGISAFSAVASRVGAPLTNDFILISGVFPKLKQLISAGFSVILYNQSSKQINDALQVVPSNRPCALCRDVTRPEEVVDVLTAFDLSKNLGAKAVSIKEKSEDKTRYTMIITANNSHIVDGRIISKRGYDRRYEY